MAKILRLTIVLFAIPAVGIVLWLVFVSHIQHEIFPWTRYSYSNESMEPLDVVLGRTGKAEIHIPSAYVTSLIDKKDGAYASIQFEAYLPDLVPKKIYYLDHPSIVKNDPDAIAQLHRDWLYVTLSASYLKNEDPTGEIALRRTITDIRDTGVRNEKETTSEYEALDVFAPDQSYEDPKYKRVALYATYVPRDGSQFYVRCDVPRRAKLRNLCTLVYIHSGKLFVIIGFESGNVARSKAIKDAVDMFLAAISPDSAGSALGSAAR